MYDYYTRFALLVEKEKIESLWNKKVIVFGVGGVGGYAIEALARSGIGQIDLVDHDTVSLTNINRQIIATTKTINQRKVDLMRQRIHEINPDIRCHIYPIFYLPETKDQFPLHQYDFIVDAIDTVSAKLELICTAQKLHIPIISAMGCGNRLDPTKIRQMDLYETKGDPLAKVMRHECRKKGIVSLPIVCSIEPSLKPNQNQDILKEKTAKWSIPGSSPFVPPAAGLAIAHYVITTLFQNGR